MSTTTHTPGPWRVNRHGDAVVSDTARVTIANVPTSRADADLIAAAPETAAERDRLREEVARLGRERDELRQAWAQDPQLVTWQTERDRLQAENAALVAALRAYYDECGCVGDDDFPSDRRCVLCVAARAALAAHAARTARTEGGTP